MTLVDHLSLGVPAIEPARTFYDTLLATLDCRCLAATDSLAAYGNDRVEFLLLKPFDGGPASGGNGTHVAFAAASRAAVDAFHAFAIQNGGGDEGAPGIRDAYPMADVYAAYVRDPFGNKLEVVHNGFTVPR